VPFLKGLAGVGSGFKAANAAHQPVEGSRVIERAMEFDPRRCSQKCGQAAPLRPLGTGQENGNHAKTPGAIVDAPIDGRTHLLVLPGAKATGTHKDGASFRFGQGLFDGWLPGIARNQVPFIQPSPRPRIVRAWLKAMLA
jgi:hypothetical protein